MGWGMEPQVCPLYSAAGGDEDVYTEGDQKLWPPVCKKSCFSFFRSQFFWVAVKSQLIKKKLFENKWIQTGSTH